MQLLVTIGQQSKAASFIALQFTFIVS